MESYQVSLCDLPWWAVLASWVLPALIGYFWGMLQWGRYKTKAKTADKELSSASKRIVNLENEINECRKAYEKVSKEKDRLAASPAQKIIEPKLKPMPNEGSIASTETHSHNDIIHATRKIFGYAIRRNDLKIVDGIDPKIEKILYEVGVHTWADLESIDINYLTNLLKEAGYPTVDPRSWAFESSLAKQEKWAELKAFQEKGQTD